MNRGGFEQYGRELVEAGRRRQLGMAPRSPRRSPARRKLATGLTVLSAVAVVVVIGVTGGDGGGSAQAAGLLARARQLEASAPPCRIAHSNTQSLLLGTRPLPSTVAAVGALGRPQSEAERALLVRLARHKLKGLPPSQILGDSLRVLDGSSGLNAVLLVTRNAPLTGQVDPVACLLRQRAVLPRLAGKTSHAILVRAERALTAEVAAHSSTSATGTESVYVVFRDARDRTLGHTSAPVATFEKDGAIAEDLTSARSARMPRILGVFPTSAHAIATGSANGGRRLAAPVTNNFASILIPRAFGRQIVVALLGADGRPLRSVTLKI